MSKTILFIDGENFINKAEEVLKSQGIDSITPQNRVVSWAFCDIL